MSILTIDETMELPEVLLNGLLKQFYNEPMECIAILVEKFCDEHFTKWSKRLRWDKNHAYIYVNPNHYVSWQRTKPRIAVAYQLRSKTCCYRRFPGQSKENWGWKQQWRGGTMPIITTAHPFDSGKIYSIPVEFFEALLKMGDPELYQKYFQTISI